MRTTSASVVPLVIFVFFLFSFFDQLRFGSVIVGNGYAATSSPWNLKCPLLLFVAAILPMECHHLDTNHFSAFNWHFFILYTRIGHRHEYGVRRKWGDGERKWVRAKMCNNIITKRNESLIKKQRGWDIWTLWTLSLRNDRMPLADHVCRIQWTFRINNIPGIMLIIYYL